MLLLLAILVVNYFAAGETVLWFAAWVTPMLVVWAMRSYRRWYQYWLVWLALYLGSVFNQQGMTPLPPPVEVIFIGFTVFVALIPFWLDRHFYRREQSFIATLVLPTSMVLIDLFNSLTSPWGSWGSIAYTQADNHALIQLASIAGIYGITFLIYWTATVVPYLYRPLTQRRMPAPAWLYLLVLAAVLVYGSVRAVPQTDGGPRVASIVKSNFELIPSVYRDYSGESLAIPRTISQADPLMAKIGPAMQDFFQNPSTEKYAATREQLLQIQNQAFALAQQAAAEGAQLLVWYEGQFYTFADGEQALIERGRAFASSKQVMLMMPMAVIDSDKIGKAAFYMKNQIVIIDRNGEVIEIYHKARPVPGAEPVQPGGDKLPLIEMDKTRLVPVICYDADFPELISQVGRQQADLLIIPSGDWYQIRKTHSNMARFRAIENGVIVVRPANNGMNAIIGPDGRVLASRNYFEEHDNMIVQTLPLPQGQTFYSHYPQLFSYFSALLALSLLVYYLLVARRNK